ncbi:hypothetical protein [Paenibacillus koleovorans]|uniref:hypothetical protein n=1 Tax=Paenibacillus koleovorans TaxID=121608 RepID=UPI000FD6C69A|nr:hypothetical protein [Paenibacillus koleovorans]
MSLKSVEMQMAIPRTKDAGMVQNQLIHKPMLDQAQLAAGTAQETIRSRQKTAKVEEAQPQRIKDEQSRGGNKPPGKSPYASAAKSTKKQAEESAEHPYKGHHIDMSL